MTKAKNKPLLTDKTGTPSADGNALRLKGDTEDKRKSAIASVITTSSLARRGLSSATTRAQRLT